MSDADEPGRGTIAIEAIVYALMFLAVGGLFVGMRVLREGPRVLTHDLRPPR